MTSRSTLVDRRRRRRRTPAHPAAPLTRRRRRTRPTAHRLPRRQLGHPPPAPPPAKPSTSPSQNADARTLQPPPEGLPQFEQFRQAGDAVPLPVHQAGQSRRTRASAQHRSAQSSCTGPLVAPGWHPEPITHPATTSPGGSACPAIEGPTPRERLDRTVPPLYEAGSVTADASTHTVS